jgi:hypothetical protein
MTTLIGGGFASPSFVCCSEEVFCGEVGGGEGHLDCSECSIGAGSGGVCFGVCLSF